MELEAQWKLENFQKSFDNVLLYDDKLHTLRQMIYVKLMEIPSQKFENFLFKYFT